MVASIAVHAGVLGLVSLGPALALSDQQSLYEQVIAPYLHQLVWYTFRPELPTISPSEQEGHPVRRAQFRYDAQTIISNLKLGQRGTQSIRHSSPAGKLSGGVDLMSPPIPSILETPSADVRGLPSSGVIIAILGLNLTATLNGPLPESSIRAKFPGGPMPDLHVRNRVLPRTELTSLIATTKAAPTSLEALEAAVRATATQHGERASAIHMVPPPDPSFDGRDVYSFAVQMPNIASYAGSWLMWFAEREPLGPSRELQPPVPLHKVDPKYSQSAISDGVEGNVVLTGVLQTNGRIREIRILKGIDIRLDLSAVRALFKWEFIAAQRNGVPVEMDIVAVIPFFLGGHIGR